VAEAPPYSGRARGLDTGDMESPGQTNPHSFSAACAKTIIGRGQLRGRK